jgi:hypothetical protein
VNCEYCRLNTIVRDVLVENAVEVIRESCCAVEELLVLIAMDDEDIPLLYELQEGLIKHGLERFRVSIVIGCRVSERALEIATMVIQVRYVDRCLLQLETIKNRMGERFTKEIGLNIEALDVDE